MPSVSEIARRAGVSKSTVSLVLNNRAHVSEVMRRRVLQVRDELLREFSSSSRSPGQAISALLIHPATLRSSQVFRELLQGVQTGLDECSGRLTLAVHQSPLKPDHATHVLLHDRALRPDGVILIGARLDDPILDDIRRENLPCVLLARQEAPPDISAVGMDNVTGAREATEYLINLGHRRIAFVGGDPGYDYTGQRQVGHRTALEAAGLNSDGLTFLGPGDEAARAFLVARTDATAMVFVNDEHALRGIAVLKRAGLRVPEDISVVSFDDTDDALRHTPPLTSVAIPRTQMGYWAARVLVERIRQPDLLTARLLFRTRLSVRDSGRPLKT